MRKGTGFIPISSYLFLCTAFSIRTFFVMSAVPSFPIQPVMTGRKKLPRQIAMRNSSF